MLVPILALAGCGAGASPTAPSSVLGATATPTSAALAPTAATSASVSPASPAPASLAPFRIATGDILFNDSEDSEVYAISADGTNRRHLTAVPGDWTAALSPDGTRIAWSRDPGNGRDIYIMQADGSDVRRLTGNDFSSYFPSWSPDGSRLVFGGLEVGALFEINADGNNEVKLSAESDWFPAWSPDGKHIAFARGHEGSRDIYVANADGSGAQRLTSDPGDELIPAWSPDGKLIAFDRAAGGKKNVWVMHADGSSQVRLTTDDKSDWPSFSTDGRSIAFSHGASPTNGDIWVMNADGTNPRAVTTTGHDWGPRWG
jgi:dipeptidyl aminopeptidase/acylaminoacyl peptidase